MRTSALFSQMHKHFDFTFTSTQVMWSISIMGYRHPLVVVNLSCLNHLRKHWTKDKLNFKLARKAFDWSRTFNRERMSLSEQLRNKTLSIYPIVWRCYFSKNYLYTCIWFFLMDMICHHINEVSLNAKDIWCYCRELKDTFNNITVMCGIQTHIVSGDRP